MNNLESTLKPVEKLTVEIIDNLILHQTIDSLRRAASISPKMVRIAATENCPTLFYIKRCKNPNINDWTIHALVPDILKFLLKGYIDHDVDPEPEPGPSPEPEPSKPTNPSKITPDQPVIGPEAIVTIDGYNVLVTGKIKWNTTDEPNPGNYVCILIEPGKDMLKSYPDAKVTSILGEDKISDLMNGDKYLEVCFPVFNPGETYQLELYWSDEFKENITIKVDENCILESF